MSIGFVSRDQTNRFMSCLKALSPTGIPANVTDDSENDIDITQQKQQRQRRRPTTRSPATIAADRLWLDIDSLARDVSAAEVAAASPEAALSAFSVNGRTHEANAVAAFDSSVADRLKSSADGVDALKALAAAANVNAQHAEHSHLVVLHLYALLERISATWSRIRQRRLQQRAPRVNQSKKSSTKIDSADSADRDDEAMLLASLQQSSGDDNVGSSASSASKSVTIDASLHLSATEREQLTVENTALLSRLRTDIDAARELERSVARVGVLQRVFASKMAEQAEQIDHVHAVMGDARAAVSRGNEELIVATAHGVDFRIFVLMFLITMSVALLFLDWYG